ncbi:MAG: VWA domain-containing protein [Nitriliruptoraceae bacterium]
MNAAPAFEALLARVLDLHGALRRSGVSVAATASIDAARCLAHVDLARREQVRAALATSTLTTAAHRALFDDLFDLYLPARVPANTGDGDPGVLVATGPRDLDERLDEVADALDGEGDERLRDLARTLVTELGAVAGRDGTVAHYAYRVQRALSSDDLLRRLARHIDHPDGAQTETLEDRLRRDRFEARLDALRDEVDAQVRHRTAARRGADDVAARLQHAPLVDRDLLRMSPADQRELQATLRPLARRLAVRMSARRQRSGSGRVDLRRTVHRAMSTGGIPFEPRLVARRVQRPELFVLCDVSGSVASFSRFTLMLVHALQGQFSRVRSFAFIDTMDEVTRWMDTDDLAGAVASLTAGADLVRRDGHTDHGHALQGFAERWGRDVGPRTTVLVLGDARNNHRQAGAWVLREIHDRARHVYWLNPEPRRHWDTGDSIASAYARHVDEMVEVRNLRQLAGFVERI